jgi:hypothetical protein
MRALLIFAVLLLLHSIASAAVSYDTATVVAGEGVDNLSTSHTTTGSSDRLLTSCASYRGALTVSSFTYNAVALTEHSSVEVTADFFVKHYRLIAPATGANTIAVTLSGSSSGIVLGTKTFSGAHQTTPLGTAVTNFGATTSGPASVNVGSLSGEIMDDCFIFYGNGDATVAAVSGQTERFNGVVTNSFPRGQGSTAAGTGAPVIMSYSWDGSSQYWGITASAVKQVGAVAAAVKRGPVILQ